MKIIAMAGSTSRKPDFERCVRILTLKGYLVLNLNIFGKYDNIRLSEKNLNDLREQQKKRIQLSDILFVIGDKYTIGEDTIKEVEYAKSLEKEIIYSEDYFNIV